MFFHSWARGEPERVLGKMVLGRDNVVRDFSTRLNLHCEKGRVDPRGNSLIIISEPGVVLTALQNIL